MQWSTRCGVALATSALYSIVLIDAALPRKTQTSMPLSAATWTSDMHIFGYHDDDHVLERFRSGFYLTDTTFLNGEEVLETYVTREYVQGLQRRDNPNRPLPYKLHAVFLDAATGALVRQMSWTSDYKKIGLVRRDDGGFSVFLGDRVEIYSRGEFGSPARTLQLPALAGGDEVLQGFSASPTGNTMLVMYGDSQPNLCVFVVNENIGAELKNCDFSNGTVTSDAELAAAIGDPSSDDSQVLVRTFQGPWRSLCGSGCGAPEFVAEDRLLIWKDGLALIGNNGKDIFSAIPMKLGAVDICYYSAHTGFLAVPDFGPLDTGPFRSHPLMEIVIYDSSSHKRLFEVRNGGKKRIRNLQGLAISPSGDRLALEGDGILRCYNLPPRQN